MNELLQWFQAQDHTTQVLLAFWGSWGVITAAVGVLSLVAWLVKRRRHPLADVLTEAMREPIIPPTYTPKPLSERHAEMKAREEWENMTREEQIRWALERNRFVLPIEPSCKIKVSDCDDDPPSVSPKDWTEDHWLEVSGKIAPSQTIVWRRALESADDDMLEVSATMTTPYTAKLEKRTYMNPDGNILIVEGPPEVFEDDDEEPNKVWYHPGSEKQAAEELLIFLEESLNTSPPAPDSSDLYLRAIGRLRYTVRVFYGHEEE